MSKIFVQEGVWYWGRQLTNNNIKAVVNLWGDELSQIKYLGLHIPPGSYAPDWKGQIFSGSLLGNSLYVHFKAHQTNVATYLRAGVWMVAVIRIKALAPSWRNCSQRLAKRKWNTSHSFLSACHLPVEKGHSWDTLRGWTCFPIKCGINNAWNPGAGWKGSQWILFALQPHV